MWASSNKFRKGLPSNEPPIVYTDDGGSGLLAACKERFPAPEFAVSCDARHAVWVKRTGGNCSYGLPPWLLRTHSVEEVLADAEAKLGLARESCH